MLEAVLESLEQLPDAKHASIATRYSLLFEGGHRWIDLRRYGRLDELPLDLPSHQVNAIYPIPVDETAARN